ncbi:MAG: hypothetical protein EZS28_049726 [Streblomastix strix]|uniref:Uncharacterized protein n=1 Tax=Streblomastix strix TaxID=222440 RepID=A0A5J4T983_9EUKA|nr:MAG: hypothetical protein EZS28_049726 [Streblomastix strix]
MPIHVEQQEFSAMCLFKDMYDKSLAVQVTVSGKLTSNEATSEEPESHIDEVIIKHEKQIAYNTFYIVDDGTCRLCVFNLYFESKELQGRTQEVGHIPDSVLPADGKSLGFPAAIYSTQGGRQNKTIRFNTNGFS